MSRTLRRGLHEKFNVKSAFLSSPLKRSGKFLLLNAFAEKNTQRTRKREKKRRR